VNYMRAQVAGHLATGTLRASSRLVELIDAKSEHVSGDCARTVLAIDGFAPADPSRGGNVNFFNSGPAGYIINLTGKPLTAEQLAGESTVIEQQRAQTDGE
jgi:hypothetical protein